MIVRTLGLEPIQNIGIEADWHGAFNGLVENANLSFFEKIVRQRRNVGIVDLGVRFYREGFKLSLPFLGNSYFGKFLPNQAHAFFFHSGVTSKAKASNDFTFIRV